MKITTYNTTRMTRDLALKGWLLVDLARAANVHPSSVSMFLRGLSQAPRMAHKLATALGYHVSRYMPKPGDYFVVYDDGYESYSPAKAFEEGYTRI